MADIFPTTIGVNHPLAWVIALALGLLVGIIIGAIQGFLIAYLEIPSFVVTLGGLFLFRGLIWQLSGGTTVAPDDPTFVLIGGGPEGSLGGTLSWVFGIVICVGDGLPPRQRPAPAPKVRFPVRPMWAEVLIGGSRSRSCSAPSTPPTATTGRPASPPSTPSKHGITEPAGGLQIEAGIPFPLVI